MTRPLPQPSPLGRLPRLFSASAPLLFAAVLLLPAACGEDASAKEAREDIFKALDSIGSWGKDQWQGFQESSASRYGELKERAAKLREQAKAQGQKVSEEVREALARAEKALEDMKSVGKEKWDAASNETKSALTEAGQRLDAAWDALKGGN